LLKKVSQSTRIF